MSMQPANIVNIQRQAYVANFQPEHMVPGFSHTTFMPPTVAPNTFITQNLPFPQPPYIHQIPFQPQPFVNPILNPILPNTVQPLTYPWINVGLAPQFSTNTLFVPVPGASLDPLQQSTFTNGLAPLPAFSVSPNPMCNWQFCDGATNGYSSGSRIAQSSSEGGHSTCPSTIVTTPGLSVGRSRTPEVPESLMRQYEQATTYAGRGRGRTFVSTPPNEQKSAAPQRKYPHRSKQRKIENTTRWIQSIAENRGIFAAPRELVRGRRTVQCHAKTFQACKDVKVALQKVLENPNIQIDRIACPFSKKNEFQKKGFILYLKVEDEAQVRLAEQIFIEQGLKIRRAVSKEERLKIEAENASIAIMGYPEKTEQQRESAPQAEQNIDCRVLCERKNSDESNRGIAQYNPESMVQKKHAMLGRSQKRSE